MERVAAEQRIGRRAVQEDSVLVLRGDAEDPEAELLLLLADGMGGHAGGEVASGLAVSVFAEHFQNVSENMRPRGRLREALEAANAAVGARIRAEPDLRGMGSTFIGALVTQGRLAWASVGDSLLLLLRDGRLRRLNADHSVMGELRELVERGALSLEEARAHPKRNALRSALTGEPLELVDLGALELAPGDVLVLASDGIETLEEDEIARIAGQGAAEGADVIAAALLDAVEARARPKQDNVSVIAVRQPGAPTVADPMTRPAAAPRPAVRRAGLTIAGLVGAALLVGVAAGLLIQPDPSVATEPGVVADPDPDPDRAPTGSGITEEAPPASDAAPPEDGASGLAEPDGAAREVEVPETDEAAPEAGDAAPQTEIEGETDAETETETDGAARDGGAPPEDG